jgi:adenylate cyclase
MRLLPNIRYGTEHYPEKVARRLSVLNFAAWCGSILALGFSVNQALDPTLWTLAGTSVLVALFLATIPLWHRFGPLAATLVYLVGNYTAIFIIGSMIGTDSGVQFHYLGIAAGIVLVVGTERMLFIAAFATLAIALFITSEIVFPHNTGLLSERAMLVVFIASTVGTCLILFVIVFYAVRQADRAEALAEREYQRSETLLGNILPATIANRLKESSAAVIADRYDDASVLFADMAGFTAQASETTPIELVHFLNGVFTAFDRLAEKHGLEKIKTTGDSYMVVSGVPIPRSDHAEALARYALEMLSVAAQLRNSQGTSVPIRIGIASGPVVAGVVGTRKFFYDVWGDTVNVASRMESTGIPGRIQVSKETYERVKGTFALEARGVVDVKGRARWSFGSCSDVRRLRRC